jgi:hypothetical protein
MSMSTTVKAQPKPQMKRIVIPPPGRKMEKRAARDYVFKRYAETFALLAKH